jgi:hypothetical protein
VSSKIKQLAERRRMLQARSAIQRQSLRLDAAQIGDTVRSVDRAAAMIRRLGRNQWVVAAVVVGIVAFRRHPAVSRLLRGLAVADSARRVGVALREMAAETAPRAA